MDGDIECAAQPKMGRRLRWAPDYRAGVTGQDRVDLTPICSFISALSFDNSFSYFQLTLPVPLVLNFSLYFQVFFGFNFSEKPYN